MKCWILAIPCISLQMSCRLDGGSESEEGRGSAALTRMPMSSSEGRSISMAFRLKDLPPTSDSEQKCPHAS